jgi:large subunit ribosomal protein L29
MALDLAKLRGMNPEDLNKEALELREEIWKLRLQRSTGQLQDPGKIRRKRHDLARVLTVLREQASAAAESR